MKKPARAATPDSKKKAGLGFASGEAALLREILQRELGELREQVYHADTAEFKDGLKQKEVLLRGLLEKLAR